MTLGIALGAYMSANGAVMPERKNLMAKPEHVRAALEDEALNLCEAIAEGKEGMRCECDLNYLCIFHRAEEWLKGYDRLVALIEHERKQNQ